jgi:hypothetical protein
VTVNGKTIGSSSSASLSRRRFGKRLQRTMYALYSPAKVSQTATSYQLGTSEQPSGARRGSLFERMSERTNEPSRWM